MCPHHIVEQKSKVNKCNAKSLKRIIQTVSQCHEYSPIWPNHFRFNAVFSVILSAHFNFVGAFVAVLLPDASKRLCLELVLCLCFSYAVRLMHRQPLSIIFRCTAVENVRNVGNNMQTSERVRFVHSNSTCSIKIEAVTIQITGILARRAR